jgi:endonuclease/exonuclease/phosphatase family metal-dependent hydrolase
MLRLVTYNILFGRRLHKIIPWIGSLVAADIICLQEFPKIRLSEFLHAIPKGTYGHRFTQSFVRKKKTFGELTLFRQKKLRLLRARKLSLRIRPMEKEITSMARTCFLTTFSFGSKKITVANTHLPVLAVNRTRYKQIQLIADHLAACRHATVIAGDFNLHSIKMNKKLIAFMRGFGFHTTLKRLATHRVGIIKHQLDYVFGAHCKILNLEAPRVKFSDHYPVIAEVLL